MVEHGLIVKYEVLQHAFFDGGKNYSVGRVEWGDEFFGSGLEVHGILMAVIDANAAAQAYVFYNLGVFRTISFVFHFDGFDQANPGALAASIAFFHINFRNKICGGNRVKKSESFGSQ